jgi:hypothetical protein
MAQLAMGASMTSPGRIAPPQRVPILTEVVLLSEAGSVDVPTDEPVAQVAPLPPAVGLPPNVEEQLIERVLADLQRQVDLMLEYRLRETLAPILTRATESVVRDTRQQLASTLRDVVARAVAQELARHRGR